MNNRQLIWIVGAVLAWMSPQMQAQQLTGAGSTFAAPMYVAVSEKMGSKSGFAVNYASVGSGEGLRRLQDKAVDFGASDRPMSRNDLSARALVQFPTAIGGIVVTANLPGVNVAQLKLEGALLADIYQGRITQWSDAKLAALNPGISLPRLPIKLVVREPGSGSTYLFTSFLSKSSTAWKDGPGINSRIEAAGAQVAKGNAGMVEAVQAQSGSLGYLEYGYAQDNKLSSVQLKNAFGSFISASADSISASVRAADWEFLYIDPNPSFEINTISVACPQCWPIVGLTYVIAPRRWSDSDKAQSFLKFLEALLNEGDGVLKDENYVPLPSRAKNLVRITLRNQLQDARGNKLRSEAPSPGWLMALLQ